LPLGSGFISSYILPLVTIQIQYNKERIESPQKVLGL
jgi:hypothetical protein